MLITVVKGKINKARITKKGLDYDGSIGIDKSLLDASGILANEKVQVLNINNGERFETYCIAEKAGSGIVALYGPAARLGEVGDKVTIISYAEAEPDEAKKIKYRFINLNEANHII